MTDVAATDANEELPCDLLALTADLVDRPSLSHEEGPLVDWLEQELTRLPWLQVTRVADNLVARTEQGHPRRVVLAGHTDTVPPNGNEHARIEGDLLWGLGSCDMKSGVAIMLALARSLPVTAIDVSYVFYAAEEVDAVHSGLGHLFRERPDLVAADVALLGEPSNGALEAGCQGTMRLLVTVGGERAHTARPWMGRNAIHRLGHVLAIVEAYEPREPLIQGCQFREALQAVKVSGGVAGNVVPDVASVALNHRFAPDRSPAEAEAHIRAVLAPALDDGDTVEVVDVYGGAPPALDHPLVAALVGRADLPVVAKLGWTDVARFAEHGIPAANFGPGDPTIAHTADERVERRMLEWCFRVQRALLTQGLD